ncbi:hypothetical protein CHUAL_005438 [Chamberlinius hualienensis]
MSLCLSLSVVLGNVNIYTYTIEYIVCICVHIVVVVTLSFLVTAPFNCGGYRNTQLTHTEFYVKLEISCSVATFTISGKDDNHKRRNKYRANIVQLSPSRNELMIRA